MQENAYRESGEKVQSDPTAKKSSYMQNEGWYFSKSWVLNVILDISRTTTTISGKTLPKVCIPKILSKPIQSQIMMDTFDYHYFVEMKELICTE